MKKAVFKILLLALLSTTMSSCKRKSTPDLPSVTVLSQNSGIIDPEKDNTSKIPQITGINKSPDRLTKEIGVYTVTLIIEGEKVKLEDTEFSINGKDWQQSNEFNNVGCGKYIFYARNKKDKSLQDQKEMFFECFIEVELPAISHLNELLKQIAGCDDKSSDEFRKFGKNLPVRGVTNVANIEQLVRDACTNGIIYTIQKIDCDSNGNLKEIIINKK